MEFERLALTGDPAETAARLRQLVPGGESVQNVVAEIVAEVRRNGDEAVRAYNRRFAPPADRPLRVQQTELEAAADALGPELRQSLELAIANVDKVARGWNAAAEATVEFEHHSVRLRHAPVARAGVYVPGGRAPYPSTVVMGVVTARAAGVPEVAVCAPPDAQGEIDPVTLGACWLAQASDVYRMGGAQGIAALAHGTETVKAAEVIVGPGNLYVQEAKRQVSGQVGIDAFAGPSDILVIADGGADAELVALDLLAQAEHGPGTLVIGISNDPALLTRLEQALAQAPDTGALARLIEATDLEQALALTEAFAPEHLELVGSTAEALAPRITTAGCVFVGPGSGTAFGDYIAGSNHVLPTGGAAHFASGLSPRHFIRTFTEVRIADPSALARAGAAIADAEGFSAHARSMRARIRDNGSDEP